MLDEVLKVLGVEKLDEAQQVEISEKIETMIDVKARERADELLKEDKEALVEEYEAKFEDYKKDITSKFSDFVDSVLDEELEIPEKVLKYAKQGELYEELIEQFKIRLAIDEGLLDEEAKSLLREAKDEILKLKTMVNEGIQKQMELKEDAKVMAAQLYLRTKCDGLLEDQKTKVMGLIGEETSRAEIDKKFKYIVENILKESVPAGEETPAGEAASNTNICPKCGAICSAKGENGTCICEVCGAKAEDAKDSVVPAESGKGVVEVGAETTTQVESTTLTESESPFEKQKKIWQKMLKENRV